MNRFFRKLSLTRKIILYYIPLSLIPLLFVAMIMSNTYENLITQRTLSSASDNSNLIINQIESIFQSGEECGNLLTININSIYNRESITPSATTNLTRFNSISNQLSFALLTFKNIDSIAYYDANGLLHTSNYRLSDLSSQFYTSELYEKLQGTTGPNIWFPMMHREYLNQNPEIAIISMGKKIVDISNGSTLGYLLINITETSLKRILELQEYDYWIIDSSSQLQSTNGQEQALTPLNQSIFDENLLKNQTYIGVRELNKVKYVTTMLPFNNTNWRLIGQVPYKVLTADLQQLTLFLLAIMAGVVILVIMSSWLFSYFISKPIRLLNQGMKKVSQGEFDIRLESISNDEIGTMAISFNHMSEKIDELLNSLEVQQRKKREYELALIQEQIKPHFLYNCLDVIYTLNLMGKSKEAATATKALADYYRVSLSKGQDIIRLEDELKNVRDYLSLQQIRYSDVFDYTITCPPELYSFKIMKLTLQPLVENAIYHGLKARDEMGHLWIDVTMSHKLLTIEIKDNGMGMDESKIATLLEPSDERKNYGLFNVQHRIQLFFGETFGLTIRSKNGEGTSIYVTIPALLDDPQFRRNL